MALAYAQVRSERIDVEAQRALMRMSNDPRTAAQAERMAGAVQGGSLRGIYIENQLEPAQRAKVWTGSWPYLIPKGEDSVVVLDPADQNAPPLIAFRRAVAKDRARLDPALLKAFETFELWQSGRIVEDYRPHSRPATNLIPSGRHVISLVSTTIIGCSPYSSLFISICAFIPSQGALMLLRGARSGSTYVQARDRNGTNLGLLTDGRGFSPDIGIPPSFRFIGRLRLDLRDGSILQAVRMVADESVNPTSGTVLCPPNPGTAGSMGFYSMPAPPPQPRLRVFNVFFFAAVENRCPSVPFTWTASALLTVTVPMDLSRATVRLNGRARVFAIEAFVGPFPFACNPAGTPILTRILNAPSVLLSDIEERPFDGVAQLT